jgi:hypothetical protein
MQEMQEIQNLDLALFSLLFGLVYIYKEEIKLKTSGKSKQDFTRLQKFGLVPLTDMEKMFYNILDISNWYCFLFGFAFVLLA